MGNKLSKFLILILCAFLLIVPNVNAENTSGGSGSSFVGCTNCAWSLEDLGVRLALYRYDGTNIVYYGFKDYCSNYLDCSMNNVYSYQASNKAGKVAHQQLSSYSLSSASWSNSAPSSSSGRTFPDINNWSNVESYTKDMFALNSNNRDSILAKLKSEFPGAGNLTIYDLDYIYLTIEPTALLYDSSNNRNYYATAYEVAYYFNGQALHTSTGVSGTAYSKLPSMMMAQTMSGIDKNNFIGTKVVLVPTNELWDSDHMMWSVDTYRKANVSLITSTKGYGINVFWMGSYIPEIQTGTLSIQKYEENTTNPLEGVSFKLYKDSSCKTPVTTLSGSEIFLTTNSQGTASVGNIPYGTYYLKETTTHKNYNVLATPVTITINNTNQNYTIYNQKKAGTLSIQKYDSETNDPIKGIEFELYTDATCLNEAKTAAGEDIYLITDEEGKAQVSGLLYGTYYLKEVNSSNKYEILTTPERVTIDKEQNNISINNTPIELIISKKDITGTNELAGAKIKITDATGTMVLYEFVSTDTPTKFRIEKGTYILTEETAPIGFMPVEESITFTIDEHGNVTILGDQNDKYLTTEDTITILNERTKIIVSKQDISKTEELAGATIKIVCESGFTDEWTSGEEERKLDIKPGDICTITEEKAPNGYDKISSSFKFEVNEDGTIKPIGTIDGAYFIDKNKLIIFNTKEKVEVEDTGAFIAIGTILAGAVTTYTGYRFIKPKKED